MMTGNPNLIAMIALCGWPLIAIALFLILPPRRALIAGYVIGWLFLPYFGYQTPFIGWNKHAATSFGALLGVLLLDPSSLASFRLRLIDLPMICWLLCLVPATLSNSFNPYSAIADSASQIVTWGVPYFLGRVYFSDPATLRGMAVWTFIAGLLYVPFCLYEIRMSPVLSIDFYGFSQHSLAQSIRMGGFRPMVFLQHGLAVGMVMAAASLAGIWLTWSGSIKRLWGVPVVVPLAVLLATTALVKSTGAIALLIVGLAVLFFTRYLRTSVIVLALAAAPFGYMLARSVGGWSGYNLVAQIEKFSNERAMSLAFRFDCERMLINRASQRPVFGWGLNANFMVTDANGNIESVPDGYWVIALGTSGLFGLVSLYLALLLPSALFALRIKPATWDAPLLAGGCVFAVLLPLHAIDNLFNAMLNPLFILALGGLTGLAAAAGDPRALLAQPRVDATPQPRPATTPRPSRPAPGANPSPDAFDAETAPAIPASPPAARKSLDEELGIP
ncbi:MAG: hypothetical protein JWN40_3860 [Phycisphaerales bacterium]|nr:hypothetical protein [Phycisphaerales bacterium]